MKVTSEQFKTKAENQYGTVYQIKALVDGIEITDEIQDFEYSSMTNPDGEFTFGNTCASQISFKIDTPSQNLTDREITIQQGIDIDGVVEYVNIGVFKVLKPENTRSVYTYQCVDRMVSRMEMPYFSELTYPATDIDILEEICNQVNISLDNADSLIPHTLQSAPSGYTRREIIGYIAQLQGKNAIINGNGNLELKWYNNVDYTIDDDRIYLDGSDSIKDETNYILGYIECSVSTSSDEEIKTIKSGTGNIGIKTENPFMTQEILDEVFSVIGGFSFMPVEVQFLGDFRLEVGDIVTVETYGKTYQVPIMQLTHSSDGGVVTTIESVAETDSENEISFTNPITKQMERYYAELVLINKALVNKLGVEELDAVKAEIEQAIIVSLDTQYAKIDFANIDTAKVDKNIVSLLLAEVGLIDRATIVEGHVTKLLDAVEINANSIKSGTIVTDRLLLSGAEGSILFELNNLGELTSTNVDSLDGYVITPRTINADRIVAGSITANEIDVEDIFAQDITATGTIRGATFIGGKIQSDNYNPNSTGMTWNLNENTFKSPNMSWNSEGRLSVNDIILSGLAAYEAEKFEDITHGICEKRMQMSIDEIISFITRESDNVGISSFLLKSGSLYVGKMVDEEVQYLSFDPDSTSTDFIVKCGSCTIEATTHISRPVTMGRTLRVASDVYFANGFDYKVDLNGNATFNKLNIVSETNLQNTLSVTGATTLESTLDVKGNTTIGDSTATTYKGCYVRNAYRYGGLHASEGGNLGVIDFGNNRWIIYQDSNGVNYIPSRTLVTGYIKNTDGNIIIGTNNNFLYGTSTVGTEYALIGLNSSNYCAIAPALTYISIGSGSSSIYMKGHMGVTGNANPTSDNIYTLGVASNLRWKQLVAGTTTISTSDRNLKTDIEELDDKYNAFYDLIVPYSFKFIDGESGRTHIGFMSQDVEEALLQVGLTALDFAGFCKDVKKKEVVVEEVERDEDGNIIKEAVKEWVEDLDEDGNVQYIYSLRYSEFIALNTHQIQKLKTRVNALEEENRELRETINNVLLRLQVLEERG